jgi:hypothetical protein
VCHRTVSGAPGAIQAELHTFGFLRQLSAIIHRTVRCAKRSNDSQRNDRLQRSADNVNSARTVRSELEQRQKTHQTVTGAPRCQSSNGRNRQNPNDWVTWLPHRTVRCAHRQQPSPTAVFVVGAINTPKPSPFKASKFPAFCIQYKSSRLHSKTQTRDQILSQVQNHSKHLVTSEREIFVFI